MTPKRKGAEKYHLVFPQLPRKMCITLDNGKYWAAKANFILNHSGIKYIVYSF